MIIHHNAEILPKIKNNTRLSLRRTFLPASPYDASLAQSDILQEIISSKIKGSCQRSIRGEKVASGRGGNRLVWEVIWKASAPTIHYPCLHPLTDRFTKYQLESRSRKMYSTVTTTNHSHFCIIHSIKERKNMYINYN